MLVSGGSASWISSGTPPRVFSGGGEVEMTLFGDKDIGAEGAGGLAGGGAGFLPGLPGLSMRTVGLEGQQRARGWLVAERQGRS